MLLPLHENDLELFNSNTNRTLYTLFRENPEQFIQMWTEQGRGYWIKFCISLRAVMFKQGYNVYLGSLGTNHFDDFFKFLVLLLTEGSAEALPIYVKDVVSVSRFHQLLRNLPNMFVSAESQMSPSYKRLFEDPKPQGNIFRMFTILPLHIRAVGCLMELLRRWTNSIGTSYEEKKSTWKPPESWHRKNRHMTGSFEFFLKGHFGNKLLELVNVKTSEICWWYALPQEDAVNAITERHSEFGLSISRSCKFQDKNSVIEDEIFHCYFVKTAPRGMFVIFHSSASLIVFKSLIVRGFHLTDRTAVFHPFSQVIQSFTNAAFSNMFWYSGKGLETLLNRLRDKEDERCLVPLIDAKDKVCFILSIIGTHVTTSELAMKMNSNFYSSMVRDRDWTDPFTLQRFIWNLPLCMNWLEILLTTIFEFERYFTPIVHYQLLENVVPTVKSMYRIVSEAKFLAKSFIVLVEVMMQQENNDAGRCFEARKLLNSLLPVLARYMNFFKQDAFIALDAILKAGWREEERDAGHCSFFVSGRIKNDLNTWKTVPDVDTYYFQNFRSIIFWFTTETWPDINRNRSNYKDVLETLKNYKLGSINTLTDKKNPYEFKAIHHRVKDIKLDQIFKSVDDKRMGFISLLLSLIIEDGLIAPLVRSELLIYMKSLIDKLGKNVEDICDEDTECISKLEHYGVIYYAMACVLGDTWNCNLVQESSLRQLHSSEAQALLADTGAKLCAMIQRICGSRIECPPKIYFAETAAEIDNRISNKQLDLKEVDEMLEELGKLDTLNIEVDTSTALDLINVPLMDEMMSSNKKGLDWLVYLEKKRELLLHMIAVNQLELSASTSKKKCSGGFQLFPYYDILEHRLPEEMAAMQKCLEFGGVFYAQAYGLCRLLEYRFQWLQNKYVAWKSGSIKYCQVTQPMCNRKMKLTLVDIKIRMVKALIYLKSLFFTYISSFGTTHPINEITVNMLFEWVDSARVRVLNDKWNLVGTCMAEYVKALENIGCEYLEKLLKHCKKVWVVNDFVSPPNKEVEIGSMSHAQMIITTFTQLFLMVYHVVLSRSTNMNPAAKLVKKLQESLVNVNVMLRKLELGNDVSSTSWFNVRLKLIKDLSEIWSDLLELKRELGGQVSKKQFPDLFEESGYVWKEYLELFSSKQYKNILSNISFTAFINIEGSEPDSTVSLKKNKTQPISSTNVVEGYKFIEKSHEKKIIKRKEIRSTKDISYAVKISRKKKEYSHIEIIEESLLLMNSRTDYKDYGTGIEKIKSKSRPRVRIEEIKQENPQNTNIEANANNVIDEIEENAINGKEMESIESNNEEEQNTKVLCKNSLEFEEKCAGNKIVSKLKSCNYCNNVEPARKTYKKCGQCKIERWPQPRFYCSQECQAKDWKSIHSLEHKSYIEAL